MSEYGDFEREEMKREMEAEAEEMEEGYFYWLVETGCWIAAGVIVFVACAGFWFAFNWAESFFRKPPAPTVAIIRPIHEFKK